MEYPPARRSSWAADLVVCAIFALALTTIIIQYSLRQGRLSLIPTFDDVGYMADGAARLQRLYDWGVLESVAEYRRNPPHSPYSDLLAMTAFAVFGIKDWAPYAANAVLALAIFLGANLLLAGVRFGPKMLCLLLLATVPFMGLAIYEFRPDFCVCFLTALAIMLALTRPLIAAGAGRKLAIGALFGTAMIVKTSFFPATIVCFFATLFLATLRDRVACGKMEFWQVVRTWLTCLVPFVLIPLPHYWIAHGMIVDYIREAFVGAHRDVWETHGDLPYQLAYYVFGPGGQFTMGRHFALVAAILAVTGIALFVRRNRFEIASLAAMVAALFMAYCQTTLSPVKSPYYGVTLPMLLALEALYWLGRLLVRERQEAWRFRWASALLLVAVGWGLCIFRWPPAHQGPNDPVVAARNAMVFAVYHDVLDHTFTPVGGMKTPDSSIGGKAISHSPRVILNGVGDLNPCLLNYISLRDRTRVQWIALPDSDDPRPIRQAWEDADFVIASEHGTGVIADFLLSSRIEDQLLADLRRRSDFKQIGKYPFITTGRSVYLFQHVYFEGFTPIGGLDDIEGPLPDSHGHMIRCGLAPRTRLMVRAPADGTYELQWTARSRLNNQMVTVKLDGVLLEQAQMGRSSGLEKRTTVLPLTGGDHELSLEYRASEHEGTDPRPLAVIFAELRVSRR